MNSFFRELKQRKVYRVALGYAVVAWLVIQISATVMPAYHARSWVGRKWSGGYRAGRAWNGGYWGGGNWGWYPYWGWRYPYSYSYYSYYPYWYYPSYGYKYDDCSVSRRRYFYP
jgi:hypothetical protein